MIKGTNTDCKITDITVVGSTATVTCLFFANTTTENPVGVNFLLVDEDTREIYKVDNTTYWIDYINAYETNLLNVNINGYKEVKLSVDITNSNKSEMQFKRWYRKCFLILVNTEDVYNNVLWSSENLDLVSDEIEIPLIKNLFMYNKEVPIDNSGNTENRLFLEFNYSYKSDADFNYDNSNIKTVIITKSVSTGKEIEKIETDTKEKMFIESVLSYSLTEPILVEIYIINLKNQVLQTYTYIHKPFIKRVYGYIRTSSGVKKIRRLVVKKEENLLASNPNNLAIRLNYSTPIYAHYDRIKYNKDGVDYYKTILHVDTYIQETNFDTSIISIMVDGITLAQKADEKYVEIVLSDGPERLDVRRKVSTVFADYISEMYSKSTSTAPNQTLTCSKSLVLHKNLRPYSFEETIDKEDGGQNNA